MESGDQYVVREVVDWAKGVLKASYGNISENGMKLKLKGNDSKTPTDNKEY